MKNRRVEGKRSTRSKNLVCAYFRDDIAGANADLLAARRFHDSQGCACDDQAIVEPDANRGADLRWFLLFRIHCLDYISETRARFTTGDLFCRSIYEMQATRVDRTTGDFFCRSAKLTAFFLSV